jgi:hypothetical protein
VGVEKASPIAILRRLLTGKGQVVGASGASTPVAVPAGAEGDVLRARGAEPSGLAFEALGEAADLDVGTTAGTVAAGDDARFTDARVPTGSAGGDLGGTYPSPVVAQARGLRETSGPTTLEVGAVAEGEYLRRVGSTLVGGSPGGSSGFTRDTLAATGAITGTGDRVVDVTALPSGGVIVTLPSAAGRAGQVIIVRDRAGLANDSVNLLAVAAPGSETVGHAGFTRWIIHSNGGALMLVSDGTSRWDIAASFGLVGPDPRAVSGVTLCVWYSSRRGVTRAAGGGTVTAWADLSGNGRTSAPFAEGTSAPTWVIPSRGQPALVFFSSASMAMRCSAFATTSGAISVVQGFTDDNTANQFRALWAHGNPSATGGVMFQRDFSTAYQWNFTTLGASIVKATTNYRNTVTNLHHVAFAGRLGAASDAFISGSNAEVTSSANGSVTNASTAFYLGEAFYGGSHNTYWQGGLSEIMYFDGALTDAQLKALSRYVQQRGVLE